MLFAIVLFLCHAYRTGAFSLLAVGEEEGVRDREVKGVMEAQFHHKGQFHQKGQSAQDDHLPLYEMGVACPIRSYSLKSTTQELHIPFSHVASNVSVPLDAIRSLLEANPGLKYVDIMIEQVGSDHDLNAEVCSFLSAIANGNDDEASSSMTKLLQLRGVFPSDINQSPGQANEKLRAAIKYLSSESEDVFVVLAYRLCALGERLRRESGRNVSFLFYSLSNHTPEEMAVMSRQQIKWQRLSIELVIAAEGPGPSNLDALRKTMTEFIASGARSGGDARNHRMMEEIQAHRAGGESSNPERAAVLAYGRGHQTVFFQRAEVVPEEMIALWPGVEVRYGAALREIGVHGIPNRWSGLDYWARHSTRREGTVLRYGTEAVGGSQRMSLEDIDRALFEVVLNLALASLPGADQVNKTFMQAAVAQATQMLEYEVVESTLSKITAEGGRSLVSSFVALFPRVFGEGQEDALRATMKLEQVYFSGSDQERLSTLFSAF